MGQINTSNIIHIYLDLSQTGNNELFERYTTQSIIKPIVENVLDKYGLHYEIKDLGAMGGGGGLGPTVLELVKQFIDNKDYIGFISYLIGRLKKITNSLVEMSLLSHKPKIYISFELEDESIYEDASNRYLSSQAINKLLNLSSILDRVIDEIHATFPIFNFEKVLGITYANPKFSITYLQESLGTNFINKGRLQNLINSLKFKPNNNIRLYLRFPLIERVDTTTYFNKGTEKYITKKYYIVISSNIIKDYF